MKLNKKIAILIKTCQSRPSLLWVLNSIKHGLKDNEYCIYISDENPLDDWKFGLYENLTESGHHVEIDKNGISCGVARNKLVQSLQDEELVLRLDDDFELGGEFRLSALQTVLNTSNEIGFCSDFERQLGDNKGVKSGSIRPAGGRIKISPPKVIKKFHSPFRRFKREAGIRYSTAEFTRNLLLLKREVVEKVKWSEELLFEGEHLEFMLSIREAGYIGAYTPDSIHYHRDDLAILRDNMNVERPGEQQMNRVFQDRLDCNQIITQYPPSWYLVEGGRRLITTLIT